MNKIAQKNKPSNLKNSRQNIDQVGKTSQGAPQKPFTAREKKFLKSAKAKKTKPNKYSLKEAMQRIKH